MSHINPHMNLVEIETETPTFKTEPVVEQRLSQQITDDEEALFKIGFKYFKKSLLVLQWCAAEMGQSLFLGVKWLFSKGRGR